MFIRDRKHDRYPLFGIAEVRVKNREDKPPFTALIQNISESGMGLYAFHPVDKGTAVSINIKFTNLEGTRVSDTIEGTVVWLTKYEKYYCIGVSLDQKLDPDMQPSLYKHFHVGMKQK